MLRLFISYSHKDEQQVSKFLNHLSPLKNNGFILEWYDRKIETGKVFQSDIENNLNKADIICLLISDNFLSSSACLEEKNVALGYRDSKGIRVIPVIISHCAWTIHKELNVLLAAPTDGKPVSSYQDQNEAWLNVITYLKDVCDSISKIKKLELSEPTISFLESTDILSKSNSNKEILKLEDIFVYPKLKTYDGEEETRKFNSERFNHEILKFGKVIIAGENQSGKTTLCKVLYKIYKELNFIPIYITDENKFLGNPITKLETAFTEQYQATSLQEYDINRVVPIIDDFHFAKHQEKYIEQYSFLKNQVIIVDDIFGLNLRNQNLIKEYSKFKIKEFSAIERNELIKKWIQINENSQIQVNPNHLYQSLDEKTEIIDNSLGLIFGKGIMPSYPFFILSILAAQDIQKPLDQDITSQGYCYQALIYLYLRKEGVRNDQIDIYFNFLTELSFRIYQKESNGLSNSDFQDFLNFYRESFNLPIPTPELIQTLSNVNICRFDSLNQYNFCYSYIYYFFVAKFISEHIEENKELINKIISNLHQDENAYITIFIAHHTKSNYLLDELLLNAEIFFEKFKPSTLDSLELSFFDKHEDKIIKAVLPSFHHNADEERKKLLVEKSEMEERNEESSGENNTAEENSSELATQLRQSIKTVEVIGLIMKNRSGSLDLPRLEYLYEQGLNVHLRILSSFIEIIKDEKAEIEIVEFITERLNKIIEKRTSSNEKKLDIGKIEKLARTIFWNLNFGVIHGLVTKAIHSLGSSNLLNIGQNHSKKANTPSAFIVSQGILLWYGKNLRLNEITNRIKEKDFSLTADRLIKLKVIEHCRLHNIPFKDLKKIEEKLHLRVTKLLADRTKSK
jgi:energy-coupling factor transporter ATP-binding protein EcfA2